MMKTRFALLGILFTEILAMLFSSWSCRAGDPGKLESISIATWPHEINTLIYIAQDQNYFVADGLNVTIKDYTSVTEAVNGMLNGEADLAGKKIGVFKGAVSEFYLGRFLQLHGMNASQVTLVDTSSLNIVDALTNGTVDAIATGQPNIDKIRNVLGQEIAIWPAQSNQATFYNVLGAGIWASEHPELVKQFLNSLARAESYLIRNPDEARTIIQNKLDYSEAYMAAVWQEHQFSLTLDQGLVASMEDEARWMIANNLTPEQNVPDFLDYIYVMDSRQSSQTQ